MVTYKIGVLFARHGESDDMLFMELCQSVDMNYDGQTQFNLVKLYPEDISSGSAKMRDLCGTIVYAVHCAGLDGESIVKVLEAVAAIGAVQPKYSLPTDINNYQL